MVTAPSLFDIFAAVIFCIALLHTFSASFFTRLAHRYHTHSGLFHLLGEVEVVFGFWAFVLISSMAVYSGTESAIKYMESRSFTEPLFVLAIMVVAASRPILHAVMSWLNGIAKILPLPSNLAVYFLCLSFLPMTGSFITEPGAMTLAALMLSDTCFSEKLSLRLRYATIGVLFVNVSIGGTLTHFAAPPVLMVAAPWGWNTPFMLTHFGWKAAIAVIINASIVTWIFRHELMEKAKSMKADNAQKPNIPLPIIIVHLAFLAGVVIFAHHPVIFLGLFLFFLGFAEAYRAYQGRLYIREGLLVAFFLAGLITLGGFQQWWLELVLSDLNPTLLYYIATALTAITDNAALTYLGSLVPGVSEQFKYALVAGAVTGGGLTVIANAPNPAGFSILKRFFPNQTVRPLPLFLSASLPTGVAILAFQCL